MPSSQPAFTDEAHGRASQASAKRALMVAQLHKSKHSSDITSARKACALPMLEQCARCPVVWPGRGPFGSACDCSERSSGVVIEAGADAAVYAARSVVAATN